MTLPSRADIHPVLLRVLRDFGGQARPRDAIPAVIAAFPQITDQELAEKEANGRGTKLENRIRWARQDLLISEHVDGSERGVWKLTAKGAAAAVEGALIEAPEDEIDEADPEPPDPPVVAIVPNDFERSAAELLAAGTDSAHPGRLEQSVAAALALLGFETEVIGGSGNTDVLAVAPLGVDRYTMIVDAKSASGGKVPEHQINWMSLSDHRDADRADYVVVVGPDFSSGQLRSRATDFSVCLLTTNELAELVRRQAETPISLTELRPLFAASPLARAALEIVDAAAERRTRRMRLIERILQTIGDYNWLKPDLVLATPETLFGLMLRDFDGNISIEEIQQAFELLLALGIVRREGNGYVSATSLSGAQQMLNALGRLSLAPEQEEERLVAEDKPDELSS